MGKKKLITILAVSLALLIVAGIGGTFAYKGSKRSKAVSQADSLVSMEKYTDGISIYEKILSEKYDKNVANKRDKAVELMESKENYDKAVEFLDEEDYSKAIRYFLKVSPNDEKRYEQTSEEMSAIEEIVLDQIKDEFDSGNEKEALDSINDYMKAVPKSVAAKNLKDELKFAQDEAKKQAKQEQEAAQQEAAQEQAAMETEWTASNIVDTYQTIVAKNANLRVAPKLDADVVMAIPQGTQVYVYDTKVETAERFWCQVEYYDEYGDICSGWISYNTINYKY